MSTKDLPPAADDEGTGLRQLIEDLREALVSCSLSNYTSAESAVAAALRKAVALSAGSCPQGEPGLRDLIAKWREAAEWEMDEGSPEFGKGLDQCADELELALGAASRSAVGWRPIETAPKDGTTLLLYGPHQFGGEGIVQGAWNRGGAMHMPHWMGGIFKPTHWMPLPPPPAVIAPPVSTDEKIKDTTSTRVDGERKV